MSKPSKRARAAAKWLIGHIFQDEQNHRRFRDNLTRAIKAQINNNTNGVMVIRDYEVDDSCTIRIINGKPDHFIEDVFLESGVAWPESVVDCEMIIRPSYIRVRIGTEESYSKIMEDKPPEPISSS